MKLMQGDCLERMREIPDNSVDMVLCDPPYGMTNCQWDTEIPIEPMWEQYRRVLSNNGVVCLFATEPFATKLRIANMEWYKYDWVWVKNHGSGFCHAKNMPMKNHENILTFSPAPIGHKSMLGDRRMPYNPQGIVCSGRPQKMSRSKFGTIAGKRPSHKDVFIEEYTNYPKSVLTFPKDGVIHTSQKPVALLEYLIRTYTNPGDTVLDNCMGSGSTGVACANMGREFVGIELMEEYFEIAQKRIWEAESQMKLWDCN